MGYKESRWGWGQSLKYRILLRPFCASGCNFAHSNSSLQNTEFEPYSAFTLSAPTSIQPPQRWANRILYWTRYHEGLEKLYNSPDMSRHRKWQHWTWPVMELSAIKLMDTVSFRHWKHMSQSHRIVASDVFTLCLKETNLSLPEVFDDANQPWQSLQFWTKS